ncbi:MAG: type II toxin-antitoxin system RelE/ParE family toxin [Salinivirgaceae bacterium]
MVKRIVWSANALSDRIQILDFWYQRIGNKNYSRKLDNTLKAVIKHLAHFPEMGRKLDNRNERILVKDAYQIFYSIAENEIHIVHIWDSRRNPDDLKFE